MTSTALAGYRCLDLAGATVAAAALSAGVLAEALASRLMSLHETRLLAAGGALGEPLFRSLDYAAIARFYYPLAITSTISLAMHPLVTFFVGQSRFALESLAVIPVVNGLVFIFRAMGISFQEVGVALIGDRCEHYRELRAFDLVGATAAALALVVGRLLCNLYLVRSCWRVTSARARVD